MSDDFSLDDALSGQSQASNLRSDQGTQGPPGPPGQNWNNPWGAQNPGQPGQQYPGFPGQQYPGFPGQGQGQQYPGFPAPGQPPQYPGFPPGGQQYPGFPQGGQQFPGFPGFPGPGQTYPGAPAPGQEPTAPGQGPTPGQGPSAPTVPSGPQKVPCSIPLPGGCVNGMCLELYGVPTGKRFCIDFNVGGDVAFHFNPRFDERPNVVVRNSLIGGNWGSEERQSPKFPFEQGIPFKLQILFTADSYKVAVNNENLCQYNHRMKNFGAINHINIDGALTINGVTMNRV